MTNLFKTNATILKAERGGGFDRYGKPLMNVVAVAREAHARLEKRRSKTVGPDVVRRSSMGL